MALPVFCLFGDEVSSWLYAIDFVALCAISFRRIFFDVGSAHILARIAVDWVGGDFMAISFRLNGQPVTVDEDGDLPLLWAVRDELGYTGTKFGCGIGACGACTVHVNGIATRSCITTIEDVEGENITTIEGIAAEGEQSMVQAAWIKEQVPQCGYCQSGMIMAATALLQENPNPSDDDIDAAMTNICRCGTYPRIRRAIKRAAVSRMMEAARG
jgi:isoquinoline 1-oxidoreductase alpha subunit